MYEEISARAAVITRRTYNRPLNEAGTAFEMWEHTVARVIEHQRWLWERAQGKPLDHDQMVELNDLMELMLDRKVSVSGRTLWLGGTDVAKNREASQFNCSFLRVNTVHDVVDAFWLLLQGCGVGFRAVPGVLSGFTKPVEIEVIRSKNSTLKGCERNIEIVKDGVWTIRLGDSAEAWAKSVGKLLAQKQTVNKLVLDFSEIRAPGIRLRGYGWISSGDVQIHRALVEIAKILNRRSGQLLTLMDIHDIMNWLGSTLSSRRAAELSACVYGHPEWQEFAVAKRNYWENNPQREQSNNSLLFYDKPTREELEHVFKLIEAGGGSEPGFINAEAALKRAPWFKGVNPCAEILLGDKSFCNLVEVDLGKFNGNKWKALYNAVRLVARANYRQTCVNLDDGILQRSWHELNEFLRLCGVGVTGVVRWDHHKEAQAWRIVRSAARHGAISMADELGLPRPKAVTTIKPSGTLSKIMDTTEGVHKPLGKYIFNNVNFSKHDPLVPLLRRSGYRVFDHPTDETAVLVTFPVSFEDVEFEEVNGVEVNTESAVEQLDRYKLLMENYVDHNCSITVSYSPEEVPEIIDWLMENWDSYVGVSFIYRTDPTKRAKDLGYLYLPQEVVTKEEYDAYVSSLTPFNLEEANSLDELGEDGCTMGGCPIR